MKNEIRMEDIKPIKIEDLKPLRIFAGEDFCDLLYCDNNYIYDCDSILGKISRNGKKSLYCQTRYWNDCLELVTEEEIAEKIRNNTSYYGDLALEPMCLKCKEQKDREQMCGDIKKTVETILDLSTNPISLKSLKKIRDCLLAYELRIKEELVKELRDSLGERQLSVYESIDIHDAM